MESGERADHASLTSLGKVDGERGWCEVHLKNDLTREGHQVNGEGTQSLKCNDSNILRILY